ncbi:MAG: hypothetical protein ACLUPM_08020 [Oscillibacter sp.]
MDFTHNIVYSPHQCWRWLHQKYKQGCRAKAPLQAPALALPAGRFDAFPKAGYQALFLSKTREIYSGKHGPQFFIRSGGFSHKQIIRTVPEQ